jgi:transcriptional regulator with XRE-family HTH domain
VDSGRFGRALKAIRLTARETQRAVARRAGVSQTLYSRVERGRLASVNVTTLARIASSLDAELVLDLRYQGGRIDRLIDRAHAAIVEHVVAHLKSAGWESVVEYSFNVFGERGSVDILAWHALTLRLVPGESQRDFGWDAIAVGRIVVVPGSTETRNILGRHRAIFDSSLPANSMDVRSWIRDPKGPIAGVWLVSRDVLRGPIV